MMQVNVSKRSRRTGRLLFVALVGAAIVVWCINAGNSADSPGLAVPFGPNLHAASGIGEDPLEFGSPKEGVGARNPRTADGSKTSEPPGWSFSGEVRLLSGKLVSGVQMEVRFMRREPVNGLPGLEMTVECSVQRRELRSGPEGRFSLRVPSECTETTECTEATVMVVDSRWAGLNWLQPAKGAHGTYTLLVQPGRTIDGWIVDHLGEPISDGTISLILPKEVDIQFGFEEKVWRGCELDREGDFSLVGMPALEGCTLYYSGHKRGASRLLEAGDERGIYWQLPLVDEPHASYLVGRVSSPTGMPQAGASVWLGHLSTVSETDGTYRLRVPHGSVDPDEELVAFVPRIGGGRTSFSRARLFHAAEWEETVDIALRGLRKVKCQLVWADSRPIAGADITLGTGRVDLGSFQPGLTLERLALDRLASGSEGGRTDAKGIVDLEILSGGQYSLVIRMQGLAVRIEAGAVDDRPDLQVIHVPLDQVQEGITLRVVDAQGTPVPGARVRTSMVANPGAASSPFISANEGQTDERGLCELGMVSRSGVSVIVDLPSGRRLERPLALTEPGLMLLQVHPQGEVLITWVTDYPVGTRLTFENDSGQGIPFEVRDRGGINTTTMSFPRLRVGSRTWLLVDSIAAWMVLTVPGEGQIRRGIHVQPGHDLELEL